MCFLGFQHQAFGGFVKKQLTFIAKLSGFLCFERKTTKRKKRKSQRIFEVGEKKVVSKLFIV